MGLLDTRIKPGDADPLVSLVDYRSSPLLSLVQDGTFEGTKLMPVTMADLVRGSLCHGLSGVSLHLGIFYRI